MKRYMFDKNTKEFLKEISPQKNPVKAGEYLYPPNSTNVVPPLLKDKETAIFNGEYWDIKHDFRGELKINLTTFEVTTVSEIGDLHKDEMLYSSYILTDEYKDFINKKENENKIFELLAEIKSIDEKRIRAICEPSVKDETTGQTWLEYYNTQIYELRQKLSEVGYVA